MSSCRQGGSRRCSQRFRERPALGLAGGRLDRALPHGWKRISIPEYHVHGAVKLFTRECLEAIGGIPERLGWDTIDETYARMRGLRDAQFCDLVAKHHRHWGSADGRLRGRARHGECAWILHYGLGWVIVALAQGRARATARTLGPRLPVRLRGGGRSAHAAGA